MLDNQVSAKWTRVDWRNRCQALSPECAHSLGTHSIIQCTLTAKQSLSLQWTIKWVPRECRDSKRHTPVLTAAWCSLSKDWTFTYLFIYLLALIILLQIIIGAHSIIRCALTAKQSLSLQWIIKWVPRECRDSEPQYLLTVAWCSLSKDCTFTWRSLDYPVCTDCKTVPFFVLNNRESAKWTCVVWEKWASSTLLRMRTFTWHSLDYPVQRKGLFCSLFITASAARVYIKS